MSMTAFSAMTTVPAASTGRVPSTGAASMRAATAAASDILSSLPATAASSEWIRESRKQRALALAARMALNPGVFAHAALGGARRKLSIEYRGDRLQRRGVMLCANARVCFYFSGAPMMSPGISPGAPPSGFGVDKSGWLPPRGAQYGTVNCVPYPRNRTKPAPKPIEPFPDPDWYAELEEAKSRPVGQFADIIPQVCTDNCPASHTSACIKMHQARDCAATKRCPRTARQCTDTYSVRAC